MPPQKVLRRIELECQHCPRWRRVRALMAAQFDALLLEITELCKQNQRLTQEKAALETQLADQIERQLFYQDLLRSRQ